MRLGTERDLCVDLIRADSESQVVELLTRSGHWQDESAWRYYGDEEGNWSTIGNQQSRPEAALVEKVVNSIDARLMAECLRSGVDPAGPGAPATIREAVARFFDPGEPPRSAGLIHLWPQEKRTRVARGICVAATGFRPEQGNPSITVVDSGEGQIPEQLPETILSLRRQNKDRIPFVQGKFNMGGTGALAFCGERNIQLVVSRRDPDLARSQHHDESANLWGFTVVRREDPTRDKKSSVYTYLAPLGSESSPRRGGVLRFNADALPIFPEGPEAYSRDGKWGTLLKLYEYAIPKGNRSHILRKDGLLQLLDLLLPYVALPVRLHECRDFRGHPGSFDTTLCGVGIRLEDDAASNLELSPLSQEMQIQGEKFTCSIYAFRKGRAETYRRREGVVFVHNGQAHAAFPTDFFRRPSVGMDYLRDSLLILVDCSALTKRGLEILFMNSRDRLRQHGLASELEADLADMLKTNRVLRDLQEQRRRQEVDTTLRENKPLAEVLSSLIKASPALAALFATGDRIPNPFKPVQVAVEDSPFTGKRHPSYFRFKGKPAGHVLAKDCPSNQRSRVQFETDACNDYLSRTIDPGQFQLSFEAETAHSPVSTYRLSLENGLASLLLSLPDGASAGQTLSYIAALNDITFVEPIENRFQVRVGPPAKPTPTPPHPKRPGTPGQSKGDDRDKPSGLALPNITRVFEAPSSGEYRSWSKMDPNFDKYSALRIRSARSSEGTDDNDASAYDFFVNMDNIHLKSAMKVRRGDPELLSSRFVYGMVLFGIAALRPAGPAPTVEPDSQENEVEPGSGKFLDNIENLSRSFAAVILPMIEVLGKLRIEPDEL